MRLWRFGDPLITTSSSLLKAVGKGEDAALGRLVYMLSEGGEGGWTDPGSSAVPVPSGEGLGEIDVAFSSGAVVEDCLDGIAYIYDEYG